MPNSSGDGRVVALGDGCYRLHAATKASARRPRRTARPDKGYEYHRCRILIFYGVWLPHLSYVRCPPHALVSRPGKGRLLEEGGGLSRVPVRSPLCSPPPSAPPCRCLEVLRAHTRVRVCVALGCVVLCCVRVCVWARVCVCVCVEVGGTSRSDEGFRGSKQESEPRGWRGPGT